MEEKSEEEVVEFVEEFILAYPYEIDKETLMCALCRAYKIDRADGAKLLRKYLKSQGKVININI